jgi:hypothetical protein
MPTQSLRLSICRTPQELANARARDQALGFTIISELKDSIVDVGLEIDALTNGNASEIFVQIDGNAPFPPNPGAVPPPLTLLISTKPKP